MWFGGIADNVRSLSFSSSFELGHLPPPIIVGVLEALGDGVPVGHEEETGSSVFHSMLGSGHLQH